MSLPTHNNVKTPVFSVILPTYNRETLTLRALRSVLAQTFTNFEVIIIDDGSQSPFYDSESLKTLCAFVSHDLVKPHPHNRMPSIKHRRHYPKHISRHIFHTREPQPLTVKILTYPKNRGVSVARNVGAAQASGTWLALLDSDDTWHHKKLAKQVKFTTQYPHFRISQCDEIWIRRNIRVNPRKHHLKLSGDLFEASLNQCLITPSSVILERTLFHEYGGFNERLRVCEDYELWIRITATYPVGLLDEKLTTRYQESSPEAKQLSLQYPVMDLFRIQALYRFILHHNALAIPHKQKQYLAAKVMLAKCKIVKKGAITRKRWLRVWRLHRLQRWAESQTSHLATAESLNPNDSSATPK